MGDSPHPSQVTCSWTTASGKLFENLEGFSSEIFEFTVFDTFFRILSVKLGISLSTSFCTRDWISSWEMTETEDYWGTNYGSINWIDGSSITSI